MTDMPDADYPPEAYAPNGELWWTLKRWPGSNRKFGAELRMSAWLAYNLPVGGVFTMRMLREALGNDGEDNADEHLNRRLRTLRGRDRWVVPSNKDDGSLRVGTYRIEVVGWHSGLGTPRPKATTISQGVRRRVLDRDASRCVLCNVGAGEEYPEEPGSNAVMTIGHIIPNDQGGSSKDINNLRVECKRCNEPVRQEMRPPETLAQVLPDVRGLNMADKRRLLTWLNAGQRTKDQLDMVYDRVRFLSPDDRAKLTGLVTQMALPRSN